MLLPDASDHAVKEDRKHNSGKLIARAQPWPSSKWCKYIPRACYSFWVIILKILITSYKQLKSVTQHNTNLISNNRKLFMYLPSPWIEGASIFEMFRIQMHSTKWCNHLHSLRNCVTYGIVNWHVLCLLYDIILLTI